MEASEYCHADPSNFKDAETPSFELSIFINLPYKVTICLKIQIIGNNIFIKQQKKQIAVTQTNYFDILIGTLFYKSSKDDFFSIKKQFQGETTIRSFQPLQKQRKQVSFQFCLTFLPVLAYKHELEQHINTSGVLIYLIKIIVTAKFKLSFISKLSV